MHADRHTSRGVYTMFWTLTSLRMLGFLWSYTRNGVCHMLINRLILIYLVGGAEKGIP